MVLIKLQFFRVIGPSSRFEIGLREMKHLPGEIHSNRIIIRPFTQADLAGFVSYMTDKRVTKYLAFNEEQKSEPGARQLLGIVIESYASENPISAFAVTLKDGTFVG